jgi:heptaprenyl diphosphate synthase
VVAVSLALLSGADDAYVDVMSRFGERFGVAFQLSDDIIDVASESVQSGKVPGTDLREGVSTLPVLHARRTAGEHPSDQRLLELLDGDLTDDARHREALALLRVHPALDAARADLRRIADDARSVLEPLPAGSARAALESLCDSVVTRST